MQLKLTICVQHGSRHVEFFVIEVNWINKRFSWISRVTKCGWADAFNAPSVPIRDHWVGRCRRFVFDSSIYAHLWELNFVHCIVAISDSNTFSNRFTIPSRPIRALQPTSHDTNVQNHRISRSLQYSNLHTFSIQFSALCSWNFHLWFTRSDRVV